MTESPRPTPGAALRAEALEAIVQDAMRWLQPHMSKPYEAVLRDACRAYAALPPEQPTPGAALRALVDAQADDAGLWFIAHHATEEYLQAALRQLHAAIEGGVFPRFPESASLRLKVPRGAADIRLIVTAMREFERTAPSPQQTRTKSAREMVGHFAWQLEEALKSAALPPEGRQAEEEAVSTMRQFVGWLSADILDLHQVEVPRLADSLNRFLAAEGRQAPEESLAALKIEARNWRERCNVLVSEALEHDDKHYLIARTLIDRVEAQLDGAEGRQAPEDQA